MLNVIQGEKQVFNISLTQKNADGTTSPFDLTGATEIDACFKAGSTIVVKKLTLAEVTIVGSPLLGNITTALEGADTLTTPPNDGELEVAVTKAVGDIKKTQIKDAFKIIAKICP